MSSNERLPRDRRGRGPQRTRRRRVPRESARTVVLEARNKAGGAADTMAPWPEAPEFKVTTLSYVMSLMPDTILRDLERYGYRATPVGPFLLSSTGAASCSTTTTPRRTTSRSRSSRDADTIERWDAWIGGARRCSAR